MPPVNSPVNPAPAALQSELLSAIAATGSVKRFPANAVIITESDQSDAFYILLSGRVKVYAANAAGKEVIINTLGPGETVGELALDGAPRSASVMTLEPTRCVLVSGAQLRQFIVAHPDFALHLIHKLIHRVRALTGNVKRLALEDVYGRVISLLQAESVPEGGVRAVPYKLTQQDIAERVGSSREMVSRILTELRSGGYVQVSAGRITLLKAPPAAW